MKMTEVSCMSRTYIHFFCCLYQLVQQICINDLPFHLQFCHVYSTAVFVQG